MPIRRQTGSFGDLCPGDRERVCAGSRIDDYGLQTGTAVGGAVRDLGPGALQADGDNRIKGIMGAMVRFTPTVPKPHTRAMTLAGPDRTRTTGRMRRPTP